ncbi:MAG: gatC [Myxococcaceae bacterium]|nr:gatC [Myxococcaceae bacterium]
MLQVAHMSSPNITQDEVYRIARLARLAPTPAQAQELAVDLTRILEHVAQLSEVDTSSVEATPSMVRAAVLRADELRPCLDREEALSQAPASREGGFSVPKVLEVET